MESLSFAWNLYSNIHIPSEPTELQLWVLLLVRQSDCMPWWFTSGHPGVCYFNHLHLLEFMMLLLLTSIKAKPGHVLTLWVSSGHGCSPLTGSQVHWFWRAHDGCSWELWAAHFLSAATFWTIQTPQVVQDRSVFRTKHGEAAFSFYALHIICANWSCWCRCQHICREKRFFSNPFRDSKRTMSANLNIILPEDRQ